MSKQCTSDYSLFKRCPGARPVQKSVVDDFVARFIGDEPTNYAERVALGKRIENLYIKLQAIPIIVNKDYQIINGQYRFEISRALKLPVNYLVYTGNNVREFMHQLNISELNMSEILGEL